MSVQKSCPDRSEVNGWFLLLRHCDAAAARALLGLHRGADRDELGDVAAELLQLDVQPHADDAVRPQRVGLGLHPAHGQLARVVHGLGQDVELLVLAPPAELEAHVVDRAAEHQAQRPETGLADQQELVDRQVRGEDGRRPGPGCSSASRRIASCGTPDGACASAAVRSVSCCSVIASPWASSAVVSGNVRRRVLSVSAPAGPARPAGASGRARGRAGWARRAAAPGGRTGRSAVPMIVTSAMWSRPCCWDGHSRSRIRMFMSAITTASAPCARTSFSS